MPLHTENLESTMRYALLTTRAIALCPFHPEVMIRVGDSDAETMLITAPEASPGVTARVGSVKISWRRLCANSRMRPTACVLGVRSWLLPITDGPRRQDTGKGKPRQETLVLAK